MTRSEWLKQVAVLTLRWPNWTSKLTDEQVDQTVELWFHDLEEFDAEAVGSAIAALYRDGREWAPNGAQIRNKLLELRNDNDGWSQAYGLALEAATSHGGAEYGGFSWLEKQDPLTARAAAQYGWRDFCLSEASDTSRRAQFRDIYLEVKGSVDRKARYAGLPSAGLKALEGGKGTIGEAARNLLEPGSEAA